jgi:hypothetical protein
MLRLWNRGGVKALLGEEVMSLMALRWMLFIFESKVHPIMLGQYRRWQ